MGVGSGRWPAVTLCQERKNIISWVAMDRIVERKQTTDAAYRKQGAGKVLRSDAKRLTDGDLLAKLHSFDIEMDRPTLERLCDQALSAEEIAKGLLNNNMYNVAD
jgi:hypothetical protein